MIDLQTEQLLSLQEAARRLPAGRRGRPVHLSCILRWILSGVRTPRSRVRLEGIHMGGRWLTSVEAMQRFAAVQMPDLADPPQLPRTLNARRRASDRAEAELAKLGL